MRRSSHPSPASPQPPSTRLRLGVHLRLQQRQLLRLQLLQLHHLGAQLLQARALARSLLALRALGQAQRGGGRGDGRDDGGAAHQRRRRLHRRQRLRGHGADAGAHLRDGVIHAWWLKGVDWGRAGRARQGVRARVAASGGRAGAAGRPACNRSGTAAAHRLDSRGRQDAGSAHGQHALDELGARLLGQALVAGAALQARRRRPNRHASLPAGIARRPGRGQPVGRPLDRPRQLHSRQQNLGARERSARSHKHWRRGASAAARLW